MIKSTDLRSTVSVLILSSHSLRLKVESQCYIFFIESFEDRHDFPLQTPHPSSSTEIERQSQPNKVKSSERKETNNNPIVHPIVSCSHHLRCKIVLGLNSMHLGSFLHADELLETIVHFLDGLELGQAHAAFVGDIVDTTFGFSVLSAGSANLQVVLSGGLFQLDAVSSQFGQLDVHRGADGGAQVGGAEGQETETVVVREFDAFFDLVDGGNQAAVDGLQVTTLLHGDDA